MPARFGLKEEEEEEAHPTCFAPVNS